MFDNGRYLYVISSQLFVCILISFFVGRCAFGIDADMQNDTDNIYLKKASDTFAIDVDKLFIVKLTNLLPLFIKPFRYAFLGQVAIRRCLIRLFPVLKNYIEETPGSWLTNRVKEVVQLRMKSVQDSEDKRMDLLQLMIDASTTESINVKKIFDFNFWNF